MPDPRPSWDETWMRVAEVVATRSRCSKAQVGCVIVSARNRIESTGYNGPPVDYPVDGMCVDWCPRMQNGDSDAGYATCPSVHSEANALLYVDRTRVEGGTLYCTGAVCFGCAKLIANSGVKRVVMRVAESEAHRRPSDVVAFLYYCDLVVTVIT